MSFQIDYPVLRRSGAFQPSLATSNKSFGSSQERRIGESDEGVVRDSSPGLLVSFIIRSFQLIIFKLREMIHHH